MKKFLGKLAVLLLALTLVACGSTSGNTDGEWNDTSLYLITDVGTINDKSFNQGSWEGLEKLAAEMKVKANYLQPAEKTTKAYLTSIGEAVNAGAKIVVTPGYLFEGAVFEAQTLYPDVTFILIDGEPRQESTDYLPAEYKSNTVGVLYKEEQSGFLAGYAAVKEGFTKLGYMGGMAVPAVVRFGYGYVAGADYAAKELGVQVDVRYTYLNSFSPDPQWQTQAAAWYNDGIEVIFAAAGGAGNSVMAAAVTANKWVIGVDVDQKDESTAVLTSSMKNLQLSVYEMAKSVVDKKFEGGKTHVLSIDQDMVQISSDLSRFTKFTQADYDAIVAKLKADTDGIKTNIPGADVEKVTDLKLTNTKVTLVE